MLIVRFGFILLNSMCYKDIQYFLNCKTSHAKLVSLPYFLKDNENTYKGILGIKPSATRKVPTIQDRAAIRHAARTQEQISDIKHRWTLRNAEVRHANRTPEQEQAIIKAWNDRKATRKYGQRILSYMDGISDVDTTALRKALNSGNADEILKEAQKLKAVGKEILSYSYLDNPMQVARQFSMADVKAVNDAVKKKLDSFANMSLAKQKAKLDFEIEWSCAERIQETVRKGVGRPRLGKYR